MDRNGDRTHSTALPRVVALRKESVDRNGMLAIQMLHEPWSLSARRAWIEIVMLFFALLQT